MKAKTEKRPPELVFRDGKPTAVILDVEDLMELEKMRKKPLKFIKLEDFLKEYNPSVCRGTRG